MPFLQNLLHIGNAAHEKYLRDAWNKVQQEKWAEFNFILFIICYALFAASHLNKVLYSSSKENNLFKRVLF